MKQNSICLLVCVLVQLVLQCRTDLPPPEILARMEDKVMSSVALKSFEQLVENDKNVKDMKSKLLSRIPAHMLGGRIVIENDGQAFYESEPLASENVSRRTQKEKSEGDNKDGVGDNIERFIVVESVEGDDDAKAGIVTPKLTPEESKAVQHFVEALAEEMTTELPDSTKPSRMDFAASENSPSYKPRFDYDSYSRDSLQTKLNGKRYWRDADHSREPDARSDGKGCTMVVKKFRDPEDHGKTKDGSPVKSVLVTKECVYPDGKGPDARIPVVSSSSRQPLHGLLEKPKVRVVSYEKQSLPVYSESISAPDPPIYSSGTEGREYARDPLKSDYIDKMLAEHFQSFPSFRTTTTAIEELEQKLKTELKDVGNRGKVEKQPEYSYEHRSPPAYSPSHDQEGPNYKSVPSVRTESSPKVYEHHHDGQNYKSVPSVRTVNSPKVYEHHYDYHHSHPESHPRDDVSSSSHSEEPLYRESNHRHPHGGHDHSQRDTGRDYSSEEGKDSAEDPSKPKVLKKSFAYYRKDNPKSDPNNHQYAEEYAQGNYRSFSTDYDSDRDGPEKKH